MSLPSTLADYSSFFKDPHLLAAFSLRSFAHDQSSPQEIVARKVGLNPAYLVIPEQVHSARVVIGRQPGILPQTDGVFTRNSQLVLTIQVADCIPVFIHDPESHCFGLVHAGWRGVARGIGHRTVELLQELGAVLDSVQFLLGPSIRQCCFEVGEEVAVQFPDQFIERSEPDSPHLSLQAALKQQLHQDGIPTAHIDDVQQCTCCKSQTYYSYRREGIQAGRMIGIMGWQ